MEPVKRGWVIANKQTQNCFGVEGLKKVVEFAMQYNRIIGGWKEGNKFYFDATHCRAGQKNRLRTHEITEPMGYFQS